MRATWPFSLLLFFCTALAPFIHSFIHSFIHGFVNSFIRSFECNKAPRGLRSSSNFPSRTFHEKTSTSTYTTNSKLPWKTQPFNSCIIHPFICSFVHSFVHLLIIHVQRVVACFPFSSKRFTHLSTRDLHMHMPPLPDIIHKRRSTQTRPRGSLLL